MKKGSSEYSTWWLSYLYNGIFYIGRTAHSYWIRAYVIWLACLPWWHALLSCYVSIFSTKSTLPSTFFRNVGNYYQVVCLHIPFCYTLYGDGCDYESFIRKLPQILKNTWIVCLNMFVFTVASLGAIEWGAYLVTLPNVRFSVWMFSVSTRHTLVLAGIRNIYKMASKNEENAFVPNQIWEFWQLCSSLVVIRSIEFSFRSCSASHYFLEITSLSILRFLLITEILFEWSDFRMCGGATAHVREMGVT